MIANRALRIASSLRPWALGAGALVCAAAALPGARTAAAATALTTIRIASGLTRPCFVTSPPDDDRLFIVEQRGTDARGRIKIRKNGVVLAQAFLTTGVLSTGNEQGLFAVAFPPDYATSGKFYIHYTDAAGTTRLARHTVTANPDSANPTGTILYSAAQPFTNHNGGWIAFGPDGYLWMALGDGGSGNDPGDRAQNINQPLGKLLRFDVSGATAVAAPDNPYFGATPGLDEVFTFGLRNPWRCSFDRLTGDLVIGDVGQNNIEEIDFAAAADARGKGWNWGWRCYEGSQLYLSSTTTPCGSCTAPGCEFHFPAHEYNHTLGRCSLTGGYVYRGCAIPDLQGSYFFADYCSNTIWSGKFVNGLLTSVTDRTAQLAPGGGLAINSITSFGEDAKGEMYICDQGGEIFKIVPAGAVAEADMPKLQVAAALGTLGATGAGNALTPGITAFERPGSRIRGAGFLRNATIRSCPETAPGCLTTHTSLGSWAVDMNACVEADSSRLTRTFTFTNTAASSQPLAFVDVVPPYLNGDPDVARAFDPLAAGQTPVLATYEEMSPGLFVTHRGDALGAVYGIDCDSLPALEARVAGDQPLGGRAFAGPARTGMALSFDFGDVRAGDNRTVTLVTRLTSASPTGVEVGIESVAVPALRAVGPMPFRNQITLAYGLPRAGQSRLDVFDVRGRRVRSLLDGPQTAGVHRATWDGRDGEGRPMAAGIYFVRLFTPQGERSLRIVRVQ